MPFPRPGGLPEIFYYIHSKSDDPPRWFSFQPWDHDPGSGGKVSRNALDDGKPEADRSYHAMVPWFKAAMPPHFRELPKVFPR